MIMRRCTLVFCLLALLVLAAGGVASVVVTVPDRDDIARMQIAALGQTPDAICGDMADKPHACPFCHIDPHPVVPGRAPVLWRLIPDALWRQQRDLHRQAQARDHSRAPRAPPTLA